MRENTKKRLITAASALLDSGGQDAVTLRAVAEQVGVSHNAPYRHFRDRSMLLAAVAKRDLDGLREAFERAGRAPGSDVGAALRSSLKELIDYGLRYRARYRLLFSDPGLVSEESLRTAAFSSFQAFTLIVARCQQVGLLPAIDTVRLTGLIYATVHGAIDLEIGGRASESKGLESVDETVNLLLDTLTQLGPGARTA